MRLRRLSEYVREQNWFAVGLDLVIVFLAVFIGLQADNWNEQRIANTDARTYYARLTDDLEAELATREQRVAYYERTKRHAEAALDQLRAPDQPVGLEFLVDVYQATQGWTYGLQRTTYDELISSGIANAIPDIEVRSRLANLYVNLDQSGTTQQEAMPYRAKLRREMPHEMQRIIREHCGDRYRFLDNGTMILELPDTCDVDVDAVLVEKAVLAMRAYDDLEKDLAHHVSILDTKLSSLRAYGPAIRQTIDLLAAQ